MVVGSSPAVSVQCEEIRTESRWQRRMILTEVLGDSLRVCVRACVCLMQDFLFGYVV